MTQSRRRGQAAALPANARFYIDLQRCFCWRCFCWRFALFLLALLMLALFLSALFLLAPSLSALSLPVFRLTDRHHGPTVAGGLHCARGPYAKISSGAPTSVPSERRNA